MESRRNVIRMEIAGSVAGLADCADVLSGDSTSDEPEDEGGNEATNYTEWLYDPAEIGADEGLFRYVDISGLLENEEFTEAESVREQYRERFGERLSIDAIEAEFAAVENPALDGFKTDRDEIVDDLNDPILGDLVETELGRGTERLEITKLETLLALADRMALPDEITDPLERTKREAENGLEQAREFTAI